MTLYWHNFKNFQQLYPADIRGVTKLSPNILLGDKICIQDFSFLIQNKIDLIIFPDNTKTPPLNHYLLDAL